jgi:predicted ATP-grasp superfamily ATP-dependent carboligase
MKAARMKKINVLIPDGDDDRAIKVVQSLGMSGMTKIFILTTHKNIVKYSKYCIPFYISNPFDHKGYKEINSLMKHVLTKYSIDVVLPVAEKGIYYIHQNDWLKKWNIAPIPDIPTISKVGDKGWLATIAKNIGIDSPDSVLISNKSDMEKAERINKYPVLIKPVNGAGGHGILLINNKKMLFDQLKKRIANNHKKSFIIQEIITGSDMDISILCRYGKILAYTIQEPIQKSKNVFSFSKMIQFLHNSDILESCRKLIEYVKWNGVAHLDFLFKKSDKKLYLIDFNPRFWGTLLGSTRAGINFPYLACLSAIGIQNTNPKYKHIKYYEMDRTQMLSMLIGKKDEKLAMMKNSTLYFSLLDPLPTIFKRPAFLNRKVGR